MATLNLIRKVIHNGSRNRNRLTTWVSKRKQHSALAADNQFVPVCDEVEAADVEKLQDFITSHRKLFVLTGAGLSTESGIPDYRSEGVGLYARSTNRPVQYADFLKSASVRQRYWARNFVGWPRFSSFQPNRSHYILSDWERKGKIHWLVTQNVDALHYKAGSHNVTELHGCSHRVICLSCPTKLSRHALQQMFVDLNPGWSAESTEIRPDGDVTLEAEQVERFRVPPCPNCGGILKPEITFFGDNVAKHIVYDVLEKMFQSDALFVIGSSLEVYSGYRFINRASNHRMDIAILNIGKTRGDKHARVKVSGKCGDVLQQLKVT